MAVDVEPSLREPVLGDYMAVLRRRWPTVVALTLLGLILAAGSYFTFPRSYQATAAVDVTPTGVASQTGTTGTSRTPSGSSVDLDTEAAVVTSRLVAGDARHILGVKTPLNQLISRVTVTVPPNSSIMDIAYSASTAKAAQAGANAFATAYLTERTAMAQTALHNQIATIEKTISTLTGKIKTLTSALIYLGKNNIDPTTQAYDRTQRLILQGQINSLNTQLGPLTATVVNAGSIISSAPLPSYSSPRKEYFAIGGLLGGLLLGLIAAAIVEVRDHRIHRARDVERRTGVPVLGTVWFSGHRKSAWSELLRPSTPAGHAIGLARNAVLATVAAGGRSVLVLPVNGGTSGPGVAAALACAVARSEDSAVLVAPDYAVTDASTFVEGVPGVRVVELPHAAGTSHHRLKELVDRLARQGAGPVVVQGLPMSAGPDAAALAPATDTVLIVVDAERSHYPQVQELLHELEIWNVPLAGIMVVHPARGTLAGSRLPIGVTRPEPEPERGCLVGEPADEAPAEPEQERAPEPEPAAEEPEDRDEPAAAVAAQVEELSETPEPAEPPVPNGQLSEPVAEPDLSLLHGRGDQSPWQLVPGYPATTVLPQHLPADQPAAEETALPAEAGAADADPEAAESFDEEWWALAHDPAHSDLADEDQAPGAWS
jgi:succinoglycan biosynthesis transport protein ExoP